MFRFSVVVLKKKFRVTRETTQKLESGAVVQKPCMVCTAMYYMCCHVPYGQPCAVCWEPQLWLTSSCNFGFYRYVWKKQYNMGEEWFLVLVSALLHGGNVTLGMPFSVWIFSFCLMRWDYVKVIVGLLLEIIKLHICNTWDYIVIAQNIIMMIKL